MAQRWSSVNAALICVKTERALEMGTNAMLLPDEPGMEASD